MLRPEDFPTYDEALAYANQQLDRIVRESKDLEADVIALFGVSEHLETVPQAAELQGGAK